MASKISVCVHKKCVCTVFMYYVYINTNTCMYTVHFRKIPYVDYIFKMINIFKICTVYLYIHNKPSPHAYIMLTNTFILDAINRSNIYIYIYIL